ncbi:uncharacterized protein LAJ45_10039 [Morchella importuna]|uniref:Uncharacterized protein n=1 Tax=Morchella conica CCBAS932 TaxID=1392247 RepID=A0A3N4KRL2_9PEZI|nr:uncharacterized protein LAJ45_10039 [Morchella importuna]KAH8145897.1 hypothetical protein LAJ45_10039 [Morchella importuna]RPB12148.1 hypothetical protein P167DRAFT_574523 [Morchella conica CCBAS932]
MSDYPDYGAMSYLRAIFKANPPRYGPRPVMDTYTRPAPSHYSTGMKAPPPEENWYSKAFKFPYVGHSLEMDELTNNHWYKRDLNMWPGPVLFGRPSYGGRGVTNRQFLVQRNEGSHRSDSVEILIGCLFYVFLVLLFIFLGMWIRRRTLIRRKSMEWEERQRRLQDVERARYSHGL